MVRKVEKIHRLGGKMDGKTRPGGRDTAVEMERLLVRIPLTVTLLHPHPPTHTHLPTDCLSPLLRSLWLVLETKTGPVCSMRAHAVLVKVCRTSSSARIIRIMKYLFSANL